MMMSENIENVYRKNIFKVKTTHGDEVDISRAEAFKMFLEMERQYAEEDVRLFGYKKINEYELTLKEIDEAVMEYIDLMAGSIDYRDLVLTAIDYVIAERETKE